MTHPDLHTAPLRQYRTAREHAAFLRRSDRRVLRVHGRDPVRMVQGLITNDIANAPDGHGVYAAVLTPKGRMVADLRAFRTGDEVLLETDAAALDGLTGVLTKFVPPLFARWEVIEDAGVIGVYGPESREVLAATGMAVPDTDAPEEAFAGGSALLDAPMTVRTRYTGDDGYNIIARGAALDAVEAALVDRDVRRIGWDTLEVLRIEAGRPRWGAELTEDVIPLEAGLGSRAISSSKGCYTGQEVIIRIMHRGHVNWHLRGLIFADDLARYAELGPGTALQWGPNDKKVGRVTSVCHSPRAGRLIGLGYVRREVLPPAVVEVVLDVPADVRVVALPFPTSDADGIFTTHWPRNGNEADRELELDL